MRLLAVALALAFALAVSGKPNVVGHHHDGGELNAEPSVDHPSTSTPSPPSPPSGGHEHGHLPPGTSPLLKLNESEVLLHHAPDPLSYWAHDAGMRLGPDGVSIVPSSSDDNSKNHGSLMAIHAVAMTLAFFAVLPIGESNRKLSQTNRKLTELNHDCIDGPELSTDDDENFWRS